MGRVILGGIVAGMVVDIFEGLLNGVVLAKQWADVITGLGKSGTMSVNQIVAFKRVGTCYRKRVAALTPVESAEAPKQEHEIEMLLTFFDELRRKVPVADGSPLIDG